MRQLYQNHLRTICLTFTLATVIEDVIIILNKSEFEF